MSKLIKLPIAIGWLAMVVLVQAKAAVNVYVSPGGSPTNLGTITSPLDLWTAFTSGQIAPGSTVWLRGGAYNGPFASYLTGTAAAPITVRGYPNERATITTSYEYLNMGVLNVYGSYTVYQDFEVTVQNPVRTYSNSSFRPMGVQVQAPNTKFIDLVIHDTGMGFGFWEEAVNSELYGNIIYNCGTQNTASDKRYGHGIYVQNSTGTKLIRDNIVFNQFGWGIHAYGVALNGLTMDGNVLFNNGVLSAPVGPFNNILVSGAVANNIVITSNYTYRPMNSPNNGVFSDADLCFGCTDLFANGSLLLSGNYFAGGAPAAWIFDFQSTTVAGNSFTGVNGFLGMLTSTGAQLVASQNIYQGGNSPQPGALFALNSQVFNFQTWQQATQQDKTSQYQAALPSGLKVVLRKNAYDPTRSNLVIYNWGHAPSVAVDLSSVLAKGSSFEILNVQDYYGVPAVTGSYSGGTVAVPMTGLNVAAPIGFAAAPPSFPEFNAFVVIQK